MPEYHERLTLPYHRDDVFALVLDIERYPEFVPGWRSVRVLQRGDDWLCVEQSLGLGPARLCFTSEARFERHTHITIESSSRPFRQMRIDWTIHPTPSGCEVEFLTCFDLATMNRLAAPLMAKLGRDVLAAFRRRARLKLTPIG